MTKNNSRNNGHDARSTAAGTPEAGGAGARAPAPAPARVRAMFHETLVARMIFTAAKEALDAAALIVVHGPAGTGKTTVARRIAETNSHAEYLRVTESCVSYRGFRGLVSGMIGYPSTFMELVWGRPVSGHRERLGFTQSGKELRLLILLREVPLSPEANFRLSCWQDAL